MFHFLKGNIKYLPKFQQKVKHNKRIRNEIKVKAIYGAYENQKRSAAVAVIVEKWVASALMAVILGDGGGDGGGWLVKAVMVVMVGGGGCNGGECGWRWWW